MAYILSYFHIVYYFFNVVMFHCLTLKITFSKKTILKVKTTHVNYELYYRECLIRERVEEYLKICHNNTSKVQEIQY